MTDTACDNLPPGWVEVIHPATQQVYYVHQATKEKRWTRPSSSDDTSDIPKATNRLYSSLFRAMLCLNVSIPVSLRLFQVLGQDVL
jgi:hypothetical protein